MSIPKPTRTAVLLVCLAMLIAPAAASGAGDQAATASSVQSANNQVNASNQTTDINGTTYYQVDFIQGAPLENLTSDASGDYSLQNRLIRFLHGSSEDPETRWGAPTHTLDDSVSDCLANVERNGIEANDTHATVEFTVEEDCELTLSLASYEKIGPGWSRERQSTQTFVDSDMETFGPGTHTLTVELPPVDGDDDDGVDDGDDGAANFQITNVEAPDTAQGETANITATIENTGDENGTQNVSYLLEGENVTIGTGTVDIVFVLDQSGSMSDDNAIVREELQNFTNELEAQDINVRYAVVNMERSAAVTQGFTDDVTQTQQSIETILQAGGGGTEDNFDALGIAMELLENESREDAHQVIIDITDEDSDATEPTQQELSDQFNQTNTTYIAVTPTAENLEVNPAGPELQKRPLANMTENGTWYDLQAGDFGEQFTEVIPQMIIDVTERSQTPLTLESGETDMVTFQVNTTDLPTETYDVTVRTENDTATTTLTLTS